LNKYVEEEGRKAFKQGNLSNPYNDNSSKAKSWDFGFNRAYFENLEKVKKKEAKHETRGGS